MHEAPVTSPPWTEGGLPAPPESAPSPEEARAALRDFHRLRRRLLWSPRLHGWGHVAGTAWVNLRRFGRPGRPLALIREAAPRVGAAHGVSLARQLVGIARGFLQADLGPMEYYLNRLFEPGRAARTEFQMRTFHGVEIFAGLHGWGNWIGDKVDFHDRAVPTGLPTIPILAVCPAGGPPVRRTPRDHPAWQGDLFSKAADGGRGESQRRWRREPDGGYTDGTDRAASLDALLDLLCPPPDRRGSGRRRPAREILQPLVQNHPALVELTGGGGLSTARICTIQRTGGRPAEVVWTMMKLVVGGAVVDTVGKGAISAPIDLSTGRLSRPTRMGPGGIKEPIERHPDTGLPLEGFTLPCWREAIALAIAGQQLYPETPTIGWDVALTADGPVLVEPNPMWGQYEARDWPPGLTPYPRWMVEWHREELRRRQGDAE